MIIEIKLNEKDEEILEYIGNLDPLEFNNEVNKLLKLGFTASQCLNTNLNINKQILEPLGDKLDQLEKNITDSKFSDSINDLIENVEKLQGKTSNIVHKGQIGENAVSASIQKYFPDCELRNTTHIPGSSDFHFYHNKFPVVWIEVKMYKNNVIKSQVQKFKSELVESNYKYGIFVSVTSGISGKKPFEYEIIKRNRKFKMIIYISNSGFDAYQVMWAMYFIQQYSALNSELHLDADTIQKKEILDFYTFLINETNEHQQLLLKLERGTIKNINEINCKLDSLKSRINEMIKTFKKH